MYKRRFLQAIIIVVAVATIAGAFYTSSQKSESDVFLEIKKEEAMDAEQSNSMAGYVSEKDGKYDAYIKRIYSAGGDTIIEADYFQTLRGKQAAIRAINNGWCHSEALSKEQMLAKVNALKDNQEFEDKFYALQIDCFYNGLWLDVNDNTKIRTFDVGLDKPILMSYLREEYGAHQQRGVESVWEVSLDTLKKIIAGSNYNIPVELTITNGKVTAIQEIYRP